MLSNNLENISGRKEFNPRFVGLQISQKVQNGNVRIRAIANSTMTEIDSKPKVFSVSGILDADFTARMLLSTSSGTQLIKDVEASIKKIFVDVLGDNQNIVAFLQTFFGTRNEIRLGVASCTYQTVYEYTDTTFSQLSEGEKLVTSSILFDLIYELGGAITLRPYMVEAPALNITGVNINLMKKLILHRILVMALQDRLKVTLDDIKRKQGGWLGLHGVSNIFSYMQMELHEHLVIKIRSFARLDEVLWRVRVLLTNNAEGAVSDEEYGIIASSPGLLELSKIYNIQRSALQMISGPTMSNCIFWHDLDFQILHLIGEGDRITKKSYSDLASEVSIKFVRDKVGRKKIGIMSNKPMMLPDNVAFYQFEKSTSGDILGVAESSEAKQICSTVDSVTRIFNEVKLEELTINVMERLVNYESKTLGMFYIGDVRPEHRLATATLNHQCYIDYDMKNGLGMHMFTINPDSDEDRRLIMDVIGSEMFTSDNLDLAVFFSRETNNTSTIDKLEDYAHKLVEKNLYMHTRVTSCDFSQNITIDHEFKGENISISMSFEDVVQHRLPDDILFPYLNAHAMRWRVTMTALSDLLDLVEGNPISPANINLLDHLKNSYTQDQISHELKAVRCDTLRRVVSLLADLSREITIQHIEQIIVRRMHENAAIRKMFKTINHLVNAEDVKIFAVRASVDTFFSLLTNVLGTDVHKHLRDLLGRCENGENATLFRAFMEERLVGGVR